MFRLLIGLWYRSDTTMFWSCCNELGLYCPFTEGSAIPSIYLEDLGAFSIFALDSRDICLQQHLFQMSLFPHRQKRVVELKLISFLGPVIGQRGYVVLLLQLRWLTFSRSFHILTRQNASEVLHWQRSLLQELKQPSIGWALPDLASWTTLLWPHCYTPYRS